MAALPENDRIAGPFLATAGQTDFPADFPLIDASGVRVRSERGGAVTILDGADVTIVGETDGGFTARVAARQAADRVFVYSELPPQRLRNHPANGATRSATLEADAVEAQAQIQEIRRDGARALSVPPGEAGIELPAQAERDGKLLAPSGAGFALLDTPERVLVTDADGKARLIPAVQVLNEIGLTFDDYGVLSPTGGAVLDDYGALFG